MKSEKREKSKIAGVTQRKNGRWVFKYRDSSGTQHMDNHFGYGPDAKKAAEACALQFQADKKLGKKIQPRSRAIYFEDLAQFYLDEKRDEISGMTVYSLKKMLNEHGILAALNKKPVDQLEYGDITKAIREEYGEKLHRSLSTQQRYLGYLRAIFRFNARFGPTKKTKINPLDGLQLVKEPGRDPPLTFEDLLKICDTAPPHLKWALIVQWNLDLRPGPSELFGLTWDCFSFDPEKNNATIRLPKTKSKKFVPLKPDFRKMLLEKMEKATSPYVVTYKGQPVKCLRRSFETACKKAGIPYDVTPYDLRHLFTSTLRSLGADDRSVADLAGHSEEVMKKVYTHTVKCALEAAVSLLPSIIKKEEPTSIDQFPAYQFKEMVAQFGSLSTLN
jgi:integrase